MNVKERIIRSKLSRLDPSADAALIERLSAELGKSPKAEPLRDMPPEEQNAPPEPERPSTLPETEAGRFHSLNAEVLIRSAAFGDIWLVPKRTAAFRFELIPEELLALDHAREMFDAKIVEVTKNVPA